MLISRRVGRTIDLRGDSSIIRYVPLLVLASVVLFALFASTGYIAILFIYMMLSVGFTFLNSQTSLMRCPEFLDKSQIGSGLGLFQLLQFFSGAFGVAITASALIWQKQLALSHAYSNIYWGMAIVVVLSIGCALFYLRTNSRAQAEVRVN